MSAWISIAALSAGLALAAPALASDVGYIYGEVTTVDGDVHEGQIRWGDEEAFWHDIFNSTKVENENLDYLDDEVLDRMRWRPRNLWNTLFRSHDEEFTHLFAIRFGDLRRIRVGRGDELIVEFRNGEQMELDGGSNDVGARITVVNPKDGQRLIPWRRIRMIEFQETPAKLARKLGDPLYGTVRTDRYEFTGHIQWDNDECLTIDELDGRVEDGKASVTFGEIASIRKHRRGALVTLVSGETMYMTGSNDVNRSNRGIVVKVPEIGSVKIGWHDFEEVTFRWPAPGSGPGYARYGPGRRIEGVVETRGDRLSGEIAFDLDEIWDFELLHGTNGDTEYLIPFREIARVEPKGSYRADVVLRSGLTIELKDSQDVSRKNDGLLVSTGRGKHEYVAWRDVEAITFAER